MDTLIQTVVQNESTGNGTMGPGSDALSMIEQTTINAKSVDLITLGHKKMFQTLVDGMKESQQKNLFPL